MALIYTQICVCVCVFILMAVKWSSDGGSGVDEKWKRKKDEAKHVDSLYIMICPVENRQICVCKEESRFIRPAHFPNEDTNETTKDMNKQTKRPKIDVN